MTIDWTKEVEARKDDLLEDLQNLLRINSERDDAQATPEAPFGPGPVAGLKHMLAYGERDGFTVKNVDNYAGHIEYGEGDETLGILVIWTLFLLVMVGKQILMNQSLKMAKFMHVVQAMIKAQVWLLITQ